MVTYVVSLVQLCCGEAGILQTNITGVCGECLQCMVHAGVAPASQVMGTLAAQVQVLGYSTKARTPLGMCFVLITSSFTPDSFQGKGRFGL